MAHSAGQRKLGALGKLVCGLALGALACGLAFGLAGGCAEDARRVSADKFMAIANEPIGSITCSTVIGTSGQRAYLEYWRKPFLFEHEITVYWVPLSELPANWRDQVRVRQQREFGTPATKPASGR